MVAANHDVNHAIHNPIRIRRADQLRIADLLRKANDLKIDRKYWGRALPMNMYGLDTSRPARVARKVKTARDAQGVLEKVHKEMTRNIFDPEGRFTVLHRNAAVRHPDYSFRVEMPPPRVIDGYRAMAMKTQPTREELKKASRHFFRFGLMRDFEEDIKLSKHI